MRLSDAMYCVEAIAYVCGSADLSGKGEAKVACMRKILWKEIETLMKATPEPRVLPEQAKEVVPAEVPKQTNDGDVLVKDRKECKKCRYLVKGEAEALCQYILLTGKSRGCSVAECEHWKDQKSKRNFKHTCLRCGKEFTDNAPRTKVCPECKGKEEQGATNGTDWHFV